MNDAIGYEAIYDFYMNLRAHQEKLAEAVGVPNHDVYEERLTEPDTTKWKDFRLTPFSMFFYYVRINTNGRLVVDHYFYVNGDEKDPKTWLEIPYDKAGLTSLVRYLAINARPSVKPANKNPKRRAKGDFKKSKWIHVSYIAIFFDEANWTLRKKTPTSGESAVTFIVKEGKKVGTPNHTFFDAIDLPIKMPIRRPRPGGPTEDGRSAIVFVNHMKGDEAGNPLGKGVTQPFVFKLILDVQFDSGDPPTVVIIDPGGENGGPSVPPPPTIE